MLGPDQDAPFSRRVAGAVSGTLALALLACGLLAAGIYVAQSNLRGTAANDAFADQVQRAESAAEALLSTIKDAETGQRGFLLTESAAYLRPYEAAHARVEADIERFEAASAPFDEARTKRLRMLASERMQLLAEILALHRDGNPDAAMVLVRTDRGQRLMQAIRDEVDVLHASARARLEAARQRAGAPWRWVVVLALVVSAMTLLGGAALTQRRAKRAIAAGFARLDRINRAFGLTPGLLRDASGRITFWGDGAERLYGWRREEALGRVWHELLQTRLPRPLADIEAALQRDGRWAGEMAHRRKDGAELVAASQWALHRGGPGESDTVIDVAQDVTALRRAEEDLRQRETLLRLALDSSDLGTWSWDVGSGRNALVWDARCKILFGLPPNAPVAYASWSGALMQQDRARTEAAVARALDPADPLDDFVCEYRAVRPDGTVVRLEASGRAFFHPDPEVPSGRRAERMLGTVRDVTALRRSEEERHRTADLLRAIGESTPDMLFAKDRDSRMLYANRSVLDAIGKPAEEVIGRSNAEWHANQAEAAAILATDRRVMAAGRAEVAEETFTAPGKATRTFLSTKAPLRDAAGAVVGIVGLTRDITQAKRSDRHRELLVNELNHRVKNTLAAVQSIAAQTLRGYGGDQALLETFEDRLIALSEAHDLLTRDSWEGAPLRDVAERALLPFGPDEGRAGRIGVVGPDVRLGPKAAITLAMTFHELATNAAKYGALSDGQGRVDLAWERAGDRLRLRWQESGGPPVRPPARRGFGSRLIERGIAAELNGRVALGFDSAGLVCDMDMPAAAGLGGPALDQ